MFYITILIIYAQQVSLSFLFANVRFVYAYYFCLAFIFKFSQHTIKIPTYLLKL